MKKTFLLDADSLLYKAGFGGDVIIRTLYVDEKKVGVYSADAAVRARLKELNLTKKSPNVRIHQKEQLASEKTVLEIADHLMERILKEANTWEVEGYYLGKSRYRQELWPLYKHSRANRKKPLHWDALVYHLGRHYPIYEIGDVEADDQISMRAYEEMNAGRRYTISTIDKDMDMIVGPHLNYGWLMEGNMPNYEVTLEEAWTNFHRQLLTGDKSDDIPGLKGVGPVTANKILEGCKTPEEQEQAVMFAYLEWYKDPADAQEVLELNANLLWMWTKPNDRWVPLCS